MAFSASTHWQVINGGSDGTTGFGGGFDAGQTAGMLTDGAATSATTSAPVFTSASYNFVAGDVGTWVFIASGTNWIPGWYKIASVAANAATLTAAGGDGTLKDGGLSTAVGVATTGSPTGATWSIDYSKQTSAEFIYSDLTIDPTTNTDATSVLNPFGKQQVGNIIAISSGTGFTVQRVVLTSMPSGVIGRFDKSLGTLASTLGVGKMGGALASVGQAFLLHIASNTIWLKYSATAFTSTSTTSNVSVGRCTFTAGTTTAYTGLIGYETTAGDTPTTNRPVMKWGVNAASNAIVTTANNTRIINLNVDCNRANFTSTRGITDASAGTLIQNVKIMGPSATAINSSTGSGQLRVNIEITDCVTTAAVILSNGRSTWDGLSIHDCAITAISGSTATFAGTGIEIANITGAGSTGIQLTGAGALNLDRVTMYAINSHGFDIQAVLSTQSKITNSYVENSGGYGYNIGVAMDNLFLLNCGGFNNTSGNYPTANISSALVVNFKTLTGSAFVNSAGNDLTPNNTASAGALLRALAFPSSYGGMSNPSYGDIGAIQHQDSGGAAGMLFIPNLEGT